MILLVHATHPRILPAGAAYSKLEIAQITGVRAILSLCCIHQGKGNTKKNTKNRTGIEEYTENPFYTTTCIMNLATAQHDKLDTVFNQQEARVLLNAAKFPKD